MIGSLSGRVESVGLETVVVDVNGVGYEVFLTASDQATVKVGASVKYLISEQIREDRHDLYGFSSSATKQLFTQLLSVSGVGPKVALGILSATTPERLGQAIASGDADLLKGVSGVGKKTAERVVLELKGKVAALGGIADVASSDSAYQALIGLGYTANAAAEAVSKIPGSVKNEQERIKAALREVK